jgi:succinoglycan biosynthesis protein ExoL
MTHIAYFGHDAGDAAIRRRVVAFHDAGYQVTGLMMRRGEDEERLWPNIDLGQTFDGAYMQRMRAISRGIGIARQHGETLRQANLFFARNLDMLLCAATVRDRLKLDVPLIYECLDVHHTLTGNGVGSRALRHLERRLLRKSDLLVYSSPAFESCYFAKYHSGQYTPFLLENRFVEGDNIGERPAAPKTPGKPLRIGWFGVLRCVRSLRLMSGLAEAFPKDVEIVIHGLPALTQVPDFHEVVACHENIHFGGKYSAPEDLATLYGSVGVVWAGDFYQSGFNSRWLLPNRLYEGGYYGVPAIAPADSQTGEWVRDKDAGFTVAEEIEETLPELVRDLIASPAQVTEKSANLLALGRDVFVQPLSDIEEMVGSVIDKRERGAA